MLCVKYTRAIVTESDNQAVNELYTLFLPSHLCRQNHHFNYLHVLQFFILTNISAQCLKMQSGFLCNSNCITTIRIKSSSQKSKLHFVNQWAKLTFFTKKSTSYNQLIVCSKCQEKRPVKPKQRNEAKPNRTKQMKQNQSNNDNNNKPIYNSE